MVGNDLSYAGWLFGFSGSHRCNRLIDLGATSPNLRALMSRAVPMAQVQYQKQTLCDISTHFGIRTAKKHFFFSVCTRSDTMADARTHALSSPRSPKQRVAVLAPSITESSDLSWRDYKLMDVDSSPTEARPKTRAPRLRQASPSPSPSPSFVSSFLFIFEPAFYVISEVIFHLRDSSLTC